MSRHNTIESRVVDYFETCTEEQFAAVYGIVQGIRKRRFPSCKKVVAEKLHKGLARDAQRVNEEQGYIPPFSRRGRMDGEYTTVPATNTVTIAQEQLKQMRDEGLLTDTAPHHGA